MKLSDIDLNLLVAFEALLAERSVTHAADRIGCSQSAMSNALRRLRELLEDPVFVQGSDGLQPTPLALALTEPVHDALQILRGALGPRERFDPRRARRTFRLVLSDLSALVFLPPLLERIGEEAPGVELVIEPVGPGFPADALRTGRIEAVIGTFRHQRPPYQGQDLFTDDPVALVRDTHPVLDGGLTLEAYLSLRHLLAPAADADAAGIDPTLPGPEPSERRPRRRPEPVDRALAALGRRRRVGLVVPHLMIVPAVLASSDLIATLPRKAAAHARRRYPLSLLELPLEVAGTIQRVSWHQRSQHDPGCRWLRQVLLETAALL